MLNSAAKFLAELYIDFAPYIDVTALDPIFPYSGTALRSRLEGNEAGRRLLKISGELGRPGEPGYWPIYGPIYSNSKPLGEAYKELMTLRASAGGIASADDFLCYFLCLYRHWQTLFGAADKEKFDRARAIIEAGGQREDALAALEGILTSFQFLHPRSYTAADMLDLMYAARQIPEYYLSKEGLGREQSRRNPVIAEHLATIARREAIEHQRAVREMFAELEARRDQGRLDQVERVRAKRKIGVNEPCPCGSGKKYKKCCLSRR